MTLSRLQRNIPGTSCLYNQPGRKSRNSTWPKKYCSCFKDILGWSLEMKKTILSSIRFPCLIVPIAPFPPFWNIFSNMETWFGPARPFLTGSFCFFFFFFFSSIFFSSSSLLSYHLFSIFLEWDNSPLALRPLRKASKIILETAKRKLKTKVKQWIVYFPFLVLAFLFSSLLVWIDLNKGQANNQSIWKNFSARLTFHPTNQDSTSTSDQTQNSIGNHWNLVFFCLWPWRRFFSFVFFIFLFSSTISAFFPKRGHKRENLLFIYLFIY